VQVHGSLIRHLVMGQHLFSGGSFFLNQVSFVSKLLLKGGTGSRVLYEVLSPFLNSHRQRPHERLQNFLTRAEKSPRVPRGGVPGREYAAAPDGAPLADGLIEPIAVGRC